MNTTKIIQTSAKRFWNNSQTSQQSSSAQDTGSSWKRTRCEIYTRVMWYYRPVSFFNEWKKSEYYSRCYFNEWKSLNSQFCETYKDL